MYHSVHLYVLSRTSSDHFSAVLAHQDQSAFVIGTRVSSVPGSDGAGSAGAGFRKVERGR